MKLTLIEYIKDCQRPNGHRERVHPDEAARLVRVGKAKLPTLRDLGLYMKDPKRNKCKTTEAEAAD